MFITFIDLEKIFDKVNWTLLMKSIKKKSTNILEEQMSNNVRIQEILIEVGKHSTKNA